MRCPAMQLLRARGVHLWDAQHGPATHTAAAAAAVRAEPLAKAEVDLVAFFPAAEPARRQHLEVVVAHLVVSHCRAGRVEGGRLDYACIWWCLEKRTILPILHFRATAVYNQNQSSLQP